MISEHPSEAKLQQFALGEDVIDEGVGKHIAHCQLCQAQVAGYRMMFTVIKQQQKPSFEFDLSEIVQAQVRPEKTQRSWDRLFGYAIALVVMSVFGTVWYWFGSSFSELFKNLSNLLIFSIIVAGMIILFFQGMDMYKRYRRKMSVLDII